MHAGLNVKCLSSISCFNKTWIFRPVFDKSSSINFDKSPSYGRWVVPCRRTYTETEGPTYMNLIVTFRNFVNTPKITYCKKRCVACILLGRWLLFTTWPVAQDADVWESSTGFIATASEWRLNGTIDPVTASRWRLNGTINPVTECRWRLNGTIDPVTASGWRLNGTINPITEIRWRLNGTIDPVTASWWQLNGTIDHVTASGWRLNGTINPVIESR